MSDLHRRFGSRYSPGSSRNPIPLINYDLTIEGNGATIDGGGRLTDFGGGATWTTGSYGDRILHVLQGTVVHVSDLTIRGGDRGGKVDDTDAVAGGGLLNHGSTVLRRVTVTENQAAGGAQDAFRGGGGIYNAGILEVIDSTISMNVAGGWSGHGGGIWNASTGILKVANSTIHRNFAMGGTRSRLAFDGFGGGVAASDDGGSVEIVNSTVSGNEAWGGDASVSIGSGHGGGIRGGANIVIRSSTITNNKASGGDVSHGDGGGIDSTGQGDNEGPVLANTIVAGNHFNLWYNEIPDTDDISGPVQSRGYNLIGYTTGAIIDVDGNGNTGVGNILDQDALLGPLANNGGPTMTHALLSGSPAIDAVPDGDCVDAGGQALTTDQRGVSRPQGLACDIGAFEFAADDTSVDIGIEKSANVSSVYPGATVTYSIVVTNHSGVTASNVMVTDVLPLGTIFDSADQSCSNSSGTVSCDLGDLAPGATQTVSITVAVDANATGTIVNSASVSADENDSDVSNNSATASVEVVSETVVSPVLLDAVRYAEEFQVEIQGDRVIDLAGAQFAVTFDQAVLEYVDASVASEFSTCQILPPTLTTGRVALAFVCARGQSGTDLPLWTLTFRHIGDPLTTTTQLEVVNVDLASGAVPSMTIPGHGSAITITIYVGTCGDTSGDGQITIVDAVIMLQIVVGLYQPTDAQAILANLNGIDGVDVTDVITELQYIVGLMPIPETCG